ncbi:hypothetical protein HDV05_003322 [Chytridiales sp. JEL 0842]|nr:hypothetical protein HDV05_003322 [Chytridiales sp. JEL 0842]
MMRPAFLPLTLSPLTASTSLAQSHNHPLPSSYLPKPTSFIHHTLLNLLDHLQTHQRIWNLPPLSAFLTPNNPDWSSAGPPSEWIEPLINLFESSEKDVAMWILDLIHGRLDTSAIKELDAYIHFPSPLFLSDSTELPFHPLLTISPLPSNDNDGDVDSVARLIAHVAHQTKTRIVIDVGTGTSTVLPSTLAARFALNVLGLDFDPVAVFQAERNWETAKRRVGIEEGKGGVGRVEFAEIDVGLQKLDEVLGRFISNLDLQEEEEERGGGFILTGINACGNLSYTLLRTLFTNAKFKACINVPCCYHLITPSSSSASAAAGFPMSQYLQGLEPTPLEAFMIASQRTHTRDLSEVECGAKIEKAYLRAVLETLLPPPPSIPISSSSSSLSDPPEVQLAKLPLSSQPLTYLQSAFSILYSHSTFPAEKVDVNLMMHESLNSKLKMGIVMGLGKWVPMERWEGVLSLDKVLYCLEMLGMEAREECGAVARKVWRNEVGRFQWFGCLQDEDEEEEKVGRRVLEGMGVWLGSLYPPPLRTQEKIEQRQRVETSYIQHDVLVVIK